MNQKILAGDGSSAVKPVKVLVTGGGGFLGSYICQELLDRGYLVSSFSRKSYSDLEALGVSCLVGSLSEFEDVEAAVSGHDAVIHTAALAGIWGKWEDFYATNYLGTKHVVEACKKLGVNKLVYTSSPSVVFDGKDIKGQGEELPYAKKHWCHYPVTKMMAEKLVLDSNTDSFFTAALRPHLIWGPKDPHFVPRLVERSKSGQLKRLGDGRNLVDVIYVENAAKAHVEVLEKLNSDKDRQDVTGKAYFIGQEKPVNLWEFINRLVETSGGVRIEKSVPEKLGYVVACMVEFVYTALRIRREPKITRFLALQLSKSHYFSHEQASRDFGYRAEVSTDEGFRRLRESQLPGFK